MAKKESVKILPEFNEYSGHTFKVKNIIYPNNADCYNFGEFIQSSHNDTSKSWSSDEDGVNIYRDRQNPKIGYRIYKGLMLFLEDFQFFGGLGDPRMIEELSVRQPNIKLTEFPTGIVSINQYPIGQEIPFYSDYQTLKEFSQSIANVGGKEVILAQAYMKLLLALKELMENEIYYSDIHSGNFLVSFKGSNVDVKIIDFDSALVSFGKFTDYQKWHYQFYLKYMLNQNNKYANIDYQIGSLSDDNPIDDAMEKVVKMEQKIK